MAYTTPAEVRMALVPSSDGSLPSPASNTAADLPDAQLEDMIAEASATIDGWIGSFYAVPVVGYLDSDGNPPASTPHPIDFWARNIAAYLATLTFRGSLDFTDTDPIARRYKDTMAALMAVGAGKMKLQIPDNETGNSAVGVGDAFNPYVGDLWDPSDFSLNPSLSPLLDPMEQPYPYPFWNEPF